MPTSAEIKAEIQETPGKDDEEKMENYMEARQEEILQADKIEGGLENASHPVYELMSQMKLPGTTLHARLSTLSDPDRVDLNVIQKAPEIVKRVEKIQESRAFKQWDRFTDALHSARELFNLPEEASTDELFSSDTKELLAAATDEEKEIFRKGVEAYNFIYRHLTPKAKPEKDEKGNIIDYGDTHIPQFNLGRVSVKHPDGKEGFTNIDYKIGAFGPQFKTVPKLDADGNETGKTEQKREPDSFTSVDDILEKWWNPLYIATAGGAITNRLHEMDEWHTKWANDLKLQIIKPPKELDEAALAQDEDVMEYERGIEEHDTETDESILNEFKDEDAEEEEKSEEETADDEILRKNLQRMYEAIQADDMLASEFCGTTQDGERTGKPAVFTLDENGVVEFHPNNFRITSEEAVKKLDGLLTNIGLENVAIDFKGLAKGEVFRQGAIKKLTQSALRTIMKNTLEEDQILSLEAQIPGMDITYKELLNSIIKQLPEQAAIGEKRFLDTIEI